jgi:hypothetical protein
MSKCDTHLPLQGSKQATDPQQVLVIQILDCFGTLFMDFKGTSPACFMFGATKLCSTVARGILLGVFIGGQLPGWVCAAVPSSIRCFKSVHRGQMCMPLE